MIAAAIYFGRAAFTTHHHMDVDGVKMMSPFITHIMLPPPTLLIMQPIRALLYRYRHVIKNATGRIAVGL